MHDGSFFCTIGGDGELDPLCQDAVVAVENAY